MNESTQQRKPLEASLRLQSIPQPGLPAKPDWLNYASCDPERDHTSLLLQLLGFFSQRSSSSVGAF